MFQTIQRSRRSFLGIAAMTIGMGDFSRISAAKSRLSVEGELPLLRGAVDWLNSPPLGAGDLRGKVVVVDFWTFTCINWIRTAPWVRAWAEKYKDHGLVVLGVHTPEFAFERNIDSI